MSRGLGDVYKRQVLHLPWLHSLPVLPFPALTFIPKTSTRIHLPGIAGTAHLTILDFSLIPVVLSFQILEWDRQPSLEDAGFQRNRDHWPMASPGLEAEVLGGPLVLGGAW